jgi:membrane-associated HD superfamily phosphohydrolase
VVLRIQQGELIVGPAEGHPLGSRNCRRRVDGGAPGHRRLAGWFLLAVLVVVLLFAWTWRYRQELWHRARALALLGLVLLLTALAYKLTAGRSILPYFVPGAGASMLVAILLGAGPATMITAMLAILPAPRTTSLGLPPTSSSGA